MGVFGDFIRQLDQQTAPPPPPPEASVAPGAWWQQQAQAPVRQPLVHQVPQQPQPVSVPQADTCPRCGSEDYAEFPMDVSYGGTIPPGMTAVRKQCFDCRYPLFNATGDVIRGKGMLSRDTTVQTMRVRQTGGGLNGTGSLESIMGRAINIDNAVSR